MDKLLEFFFFKAAPEPLVCQLEMFLQKQITDIKERSADFNGYLESVSCPVVSESLWPSGQQPARLILTQGWNSELLRCRQLLYRLSHQRSLDTYLNVFSLTWDSPGMADNFPSGEHQRATAKILRVYKRYARGHFASLSATMKNCSEL